MYVYVAKKVVSSFKKKSVLFASSSYTGPELASHLTNGGTAHLIDRLIITNPIFNSGQGCGHALLRLVSPSVPKTPSQSTFSPTYLDYFHHNALQSAHLRLYRALSSVLTTTAVQSANEVLARESSSL